MSIEKWDIRFANEDYISGTEPNMYFKDKLDELFPGKILLPLEGEGRNAVYAASKGWDVVVFDNNADNKEKALKLAKMKGVNIDYTIRCCEEAEFEENSFDCIALLYTHMAKERRINIFNKMIKYLRPGGTIILEGFNNYQKQINGSAGPKDPSWLFTVDQLRKDFDEFKRLDITQWHTTLNKGNGAIVRMFGKK